MKKLRVPKIIHLGDAIDMVDPRTGYVQRPPRKVSPLGRRMLSKLLSCQDRGMYQWELTQSLGTTKNSQYEDNLNGLWERKLIVFLVDDYIELTPEGIKVARSLEG